MTMAHRLSDIQNAVSELARVRQSLASDVTYFQAQGRQLRGIAEYVKATFTSGRPQTRQALIQALMERSMLQLYQIAAACLQQVTAQLSDPAAPRDVVMATCCTAAVFCEGLKHGQLSLAELVSHNMPSTAVNHQMLRLVRGSRKWRMGITTGFWYYTRVTPPMSQEGESLLLLTTTITLIQQRWPVGCMLLSNARQLVCRPLVIKPATGMGHAAWPLPERSDNDIIWV